MKKIFYLPLVCIFTIACRPVEIQTSNSKVRWVPEVMVLGDKNGASTNPLDAVGLNMLLDIAKKQGK